MIYMANLNDILDKIYVGLAGDRISLIAKIGCIAGIYGVENDSWPCIFIEIASGALIGYTSFGLRTLEYYIRTSKHIQEHGKLDLRFGERLIKGTENRKFTGYCQIQGLYLAAKKYNQLEAFYELKNSISKNIIPNF
jgi:hypothetical protein